MKLTDICEETVWQGEIDGEKIDVVITNEGISVRPSKGGIVSQTLRKGATALKANPGLAALGAGFAVAAYTAYSRNKRNTIRLFAKNYRDRKMYKAIADDLIKTGGYKKVKEKLVGGGFLWELKKR
jgi:hypothetical protein